MELSQLKKLMLSLCFLLGLTLMVSNTLGYALSQDTVKLNDLIEQGKQYDGKTVVVSGEALLEPLERKDGTWININDGTNAMGLWMRQEDAKLVKRFGDYHQKGDTLTVEAIFHRACPEHGGDMELHVLKVIKVVDGSDIQHKVDMTDIAVLLGLSTFMAFLVFSYWKRKTV